MVPFPLVNRVPANFTTIQLRIGIETVPGAIIPKVRSRNLGKSRTRGAEVGELLNAPGGIVNLGIPGNFYESRLYPSHPPRFLILLYFKPFLTIIASCLKHAPPVARHFRKRTGGQEESPG